MNPDKQRIAIATHLFPQFPVFKNDAGELRHDYSAHRTGESGPVANYPADLNAMHEAEKVLTDEQYARYVTDIEMQLVHSIREGTPYRERWAVSATAAQRSAAFLRAIGKWEDEPERMNDQAHGTAGGGNQPITP